MGMTGMKYIILDNGDVILFTANQNHGDMVPDGLTAVAAGFVRFHVIQNGTETTGYLACTGESMSLGVRAREEDTRLVERELFTGGWA